MVHVYFWICMYACIQMTSAKHVSWWYNTVDTGDINGKAAQSLSGEAHTTLCQKLFGDVEGYYTSVLWQEEPKCSTTTLDKKLIVVAPHTNTHLIPIQKASLDLFLQEPFTYIVYDDSYTVPHFTNWNEESIGSKMKIAVEQVGGVYRRVPQGFHDDRRCLFPNTLEPFVNNPNTRCSDIYQFIQRDEAVLCSTSVVLFMDADVFLISPYKPTNMMRTKSISVSSVPQHGKYSSPGLSVNLTYMWTAINVMDMAVLPSKHSINWDCGKYQLHHGNKTISLDAGGHTYEWLTQYTPKIDWLDIQMLGDSSDKTTQWFSQQWSNIYKEAKLFELEFKAQILGGAFLHLRNAGNWMRHGKRYKWIQPNQDKLLLEFFNKRKDEFVSKEKG